MEGLIPDISKTPTTPVSKYQSNTALAEKVNKQNDQILSTQAPLTYDDFLTSTIPLPTNENDIGRLAGILQSKH